MPLKGTKQETHQRLLDALVVMWESVHLPNCEKVSYSRVANDHIIAPFVLALGRPFWYRPMRPCLEDAVILYNTAAKMRKEGNGVGQLQLQLFDHEANKQNPQTPTSANYVPRSPSALEDSCKENDKIATIIAELRARGYSGELKYTTTIKV